MNSNTKKYNLPIIIVSILVPLLVALLLTVRLKDFGIFVEPMPFLPPIYTTLNAITAFLLVIAVIAVKKGNRVLHEKLMKTAIGLSVGFLALYIAYHLTTEATKFGGEGSIRYVYFFLLITHIILSVVTIPLVLLSYVKALNSQFEQHKKLTKYTFPIWLYVATTGVIVYFMISPYYA